MSDATTLLPSSATKFERDLSESTDALPRVGPAAELIRSAKRDNIPDSVVPWLIVEYGLGELLPYLSDPRTAIATGVLWQRLRGTPESFKIALGWIGNDGQIEESEASTIRWSQFQLGLAQAPVDLSQTDSIVEIGRLSSPVRSSLFRIYGGWYDGRRFTLDDHKLSSLDTLCDHTGVYLKTEWPQLSFGREFKNEDGNIRDDLEGQLGIHRITSKRGLYEDRTYLSNSILGETSWRTLHIEDLSSVISRLHFSIYGPWWNNADTWDVPHAWDGILDWAGLQNKFTPALKFARAGMYLSDYAELGDTNACLPCTSLTEFGDGAILLSEGNPDTGEGILSEHLSRVEYVEINERIEREKEFGSLWVGQYQTQTEIFPLTHGQAYTAHDSTNVLPHVTHIPAGNMRQGNYQFNNRQDFTDHIFGDGAGHLLGVSSAEIVPTHREHTRELAYDDSFELSRSRLSEYTPLINEQAISRGHTTSAAQTEEQSDQWQDTESTWATDATGTWETVASYFDSRDFGDTWQTETWETGQYFANSDPDTWANTYSWTVYPQFEQVLGFSRTMLTLSENGHLSDTDGILGNTHATLGFFEDERTERSHQTTSAAHNPSGFFYLDRERYATLAYYDVFFLSLSRLSETIDLSQVTSNTRAHTTGFLQIPLQSGQWELATETWSGPEAWDTETSWFSDTPEDSTWHNRYAWQDFPQLDQVLGFSRTMVTLSENGHLSDTDGILGDTHATLSHFEDERTERSHQTTSAAHNPTGVFYHLRERFATLAYDDLFELSRSRLSEHIPLFNEQSITREHGGELTWPIEQFTTWNDTSPTWDAAGDWQTSGWFDADNEPNWYEGYAWQNFPQVEQVLSFSRAHLTLSDSDAGLDSTNATLGWNTSERFDRDYFAQATENRQSITERQHTRTVQSSVQLFVEPTWSDTLWAGPSSVDWNESTDDWQNGSWATIDWVDSSDITWADEPMWARIARWQIASLVVETQHQTHV